jgi:hypothetical protein
MSRTTTLAGALALALALAGCGLLSGGVTAEHLADGNWQLKCKASLARCLERADELCHDASYKIVSASDDRDFYGPQDVPYEVRSSTAVIRCGTRGRPLFGSGGEAATPAPPAAAATAAPPARACVPGATQACVGAGACPGGQACLADGSGYSPCLCAAPAADGGAAPPPP